MLLKSESCSILGPAIVLPTSQRITYGNNNYLICVALKVSNMLYDWYGNSMEDKETKINTVFRTRQRETGGTCLLHNSL